MGDRLQRYHGRQTPHVPQPAEAYEPTAGARVAPERIPAAEAAAGQQVYEFENPTATRFELTTKDGPLWEQVVRRQTWDLPTHKLVEDLAVTGQPAEELTRPLPEGVSAIRTRLYYNPRRTGTPAEPSTAGADAEPSSGPVVDAAAPVARRRPRDPPREQPPRAVESGVNPEAPADWSHFDIGAAVKRCGQRTRLLHALPCVSYMCVGGTRRSTK